MQPKTSAKDFFLNLGAIVALYTVVVSLLNLLFTVINTAYPQITAYYYSSSQSISFPVATLIIFFPIFVLLMWLMEKGFVLEPDKRHLGVRKWLTYITLFVAGLVLAGDLVTVLYYFLDGQELDMGFILKVISVFVVTLGVFLYYISDIKGKLTSRYQKIWLVVSLLVILASIVWGFSVLGSPATQRLVKYDEQKINDLQNIGMEISSYVNAKGVLPNSLSDIATWSHADMLADQQTGKQYEYQRTGGTSYKLCAEFNTDTSKYMNSEALRAYAGNLGNQWNHTAGRFCFETTNVTPYPVPGKLPM